MVAESKVEHTESKPAQFDENIQWSLGYQCTMSELNSENEMFINCNMKPQVVV